MSVSKIIGVSVVSFFLFFLASYGASDEGEGESSSSSETGSGWRRVDSIDSVKMEECFRSIVKGLRDSESGVMLWWLEQAGGESSVKCDLLYHAEPLIDFDMTVQIRRLIIMALAKVHTGEREEVARLARSLFLRKVTYDQYPGIIEEIALMEQGQRRPVVDSLRPWLVPDIEGESIVILLSKMRLGAEQKPEEVSLPTEEPRHQREADEEGTEEREAWGMWGPERPQIPLWDKLWRIVTSLL